MGAELARANKKETSVDELDVLAAELGERLKARKETVAVAENLAAGTGELLARSKRERDEGRAQVVSSEPAAIRPDLE